MILVASSSSTAGVSWTEIGSVTRWVVMPRCIKGCPFVCPFKIQCWATGQSTLTILLTCNRKCCRHCPRLHLVIAWLISSVTWGAGVLKPIIWNMMRSSIQVLPFVAAGVASLCKYIGMSCRKCLYGLAPLMCITLLVLLHRSLLVSVACGGLVICCLLWRTLALSEPLPELTAEAPPVKGLCSIAFSTVSGTVGDSRAARTVSGTSSRCPPVAW